MAYATIADVRARRSELDESAIPDEQVAAALDGAEAEVDAMLARRYAVPFDPVPKLVKSLTIDLATAQALDETFTGRGVDEEPRLSQSIRRRALARLKALAEGEAVLPGLSRSGGALSSTAGQVSSLASWDLYREPKPEWPA